LCSCEKDEGRPFSIALQGEVLNRQSAASVKNRGRERDWKRRPHGRQVRSRELNIVNCHFQRRNAEGYCQNWTVEWSPGQAHRKPVYWVSDSRRRDSKTFDQAFSRNYGKFQTDVKREFQELKLKELSINAVWSGGLTHSSYDLLVMSKEPRCQLIRSSHRANSRL
jgi:hypothetical protein